MRGQKLNASCCLIGTHLVKSRNFPNEQQVMEYWDGETPLRETSRIWYVWGRKRIETSWGLNFLHTKQNFVNLCILFLSMFSQWKGNSSKRPVRFSPNQPTAGILLHLSINTAHKKCHPLESYFCNYRKYLWCICFLHYFWHISKISGFWAVFF